MGQDGLPAEFYKVFTEDLLEPLLETCNIILLTREIPATWSEARIIVLAKTGKNPCKVESYRPISLLNNDVKIFLR